MLSVKAKRKKRNEEAVRKRFIFLLLVYPWCVRHAWQIGSWRLQKISPAKTISETGFTVRFIVFVPNIFNRHFKNQRQSTTTYDNFLPSLSKKRYKLLPFSYPHRVYGMLRLRKQIDFDSLFRIKCKAFYAKQLKYTCRLRNKWNENIFFFLKKNKSMNRNFER